MPTLANRRGGSERATSDTYFDVGVGGPRELAKTTLFSCNATSKDVFAQVAPASPRAISAVPAPAVPVFAAEMAAASCAMTLTSIVFNPFDVVKIKLQTQNQLSRDAARLVYNGTLHCAKRS